MSKIKLILKSLVVGLFVAFVTALFIITLVKTSVILFSLHPVLVIVPTITTVVGFKTFEILSK